MTTSNSVCCEMSLHKRENKQHYNTDRQREKNRSKKKGVTVAFARNLAKQSPLGLYFLMRVIGAGNVSVSPTS